MSSEPAGHGLRKEAGGYVSLFQNHFILPKFLFILEFEGWGGGGGNKMSTVRVDKSIPHLRRV